MCKVDYCIGCAVKFYRLEKGMSQDELAQKTGISRSMIGMLEQNRRNSLGAEKLHQIHLALGVTCDEIMAKAEELGRVNDS